MSQSNFKTTHQLANELLAGPDLLCGVSVRVFDCPGLAHIWPVQAKATKVEDVDCILLIADTIGAEAVAEAEEAAKPA